MCHVIGRTVRLHTAGTMVPVFGPHVSRWRRLWKPWILGQKLSHEFDIACWGNGYSTPSVTDLKSVTLGPSCSITGRVYVPDGNDENDEYDKYDELQY